MGGKKDLWSSFFEREKNISGVLIPFLSGGTISGDDFYASFSLATSTVEKTSPKSML